MQSKVNHQKKEQTSKNNEIEIKNQNDLNKYKSLDLLIEISPKKATNKNNCDQINNSGRRTISKNTFLNSYKKNKKVKQSCLSNGQLYEIKINNNSENLDEIKNKSKDEKIFTFKKKEKNIELENKENIIKAEREKTDIINNKYSELQNKYTELQKQNSHNVFALKMKEDEVDTLIMIIDATHHMKRGKYLHNLNRLSEDVKQEVENIINSLKIFKKKKE